MGIEISWVTSMGPLISNRIFCEQLRNKLGYSAIQNRFVGIKSLHVSIVGSPPHPFRFRWQIPFIRIEGADQSL